MKKSLAIDFGTEEIRAILPGGSIAIRQPACIAVDAQTGEILQFGKQAVALAQKKTTDIRLRHPFRNSWILGENSAPLASDIMAAFLRKLYPDETDVRLLLSIPCGLSDEEEYAVAELGHRAGFSEAYLVYSPIAALVGNGCSLENTYFAVNVGAAFTDITIVSDGNLIYRASHTVCGMSFSDAIGIYVRNKYHLKLKVSEAERIKQSIGTVWSDEERRTTEILGSDQKGGVHRILLSSDEMLEALEEPCAELLDAIHVAATKVPLDAVEPLMKNGILLFGGGACLNGLCEMISGITGFKTKLVANPRDAVAEGLAKILPTLPKNLNVPNVSTVACKTNSYLY